MASNAAATTTQSRQARKPAGTMVGIPPRQLDFVYPQSAPRYFFYNNATATLFFAVLSGIFPPGERFFVESVRYFRDVITDDTLKAQVSGFIGQESLHGREHERLNELLASKGINTKVPEQAVKMGLWLMEQLSPRQQLACTIFMEHFTAHLAEHWLTNEEFRKQADPVMVKLWQWHALEEMEHKSVAYDVYELIGNRRYERILAVPLVVATLLPGILASWAYLVVKDGQAFNVKENKRGLKLLLGKDGFITRFLPRMPDFLKPDFHPQQHDTKALEQLWRDKLFGEKGTLLPELKNKAAVTMH